MFLHDLTWQRSDQPVLSAMTTGQMWSRVQLYNPTVIRVDGVYRMWYIGNDTATRVDGLMLGYAESDDGLRWTEHPDNPILRADDLPWGKSWQTPHVLYDADEHCYKMWFVSTDINRDADGGVVSFFQKLGYGVSPDGLHWDIAPDPLYPSARRPCVLKDGPGAYRMWMNSSPHPDGSLGDLAGNIYRFVSPDGLRWTRDPEPAVTADDAHRSVVYPYVVKNEDAYTMWYGCHVEGGFFELFCSVSEDGLTWTHHCDRSAFPATRCPDDFDGRYTSTPCVLQEDDRYLLYYSARDLGNIYGASDGTIKVDRDGIYRHIGVAVGVVGR